MFFTEWVKQIKIEKLPPGIVKVEKLRHLFADRFTYEKQTEFRYFVGVEAPKMIFQLSRSANSWDCLCQQRLVPAVEEND
jgi:hypothetical protein